MSTAGNGAEREDIVHTLLVINGQLDDNDQQATDAGYLPRKDYLELRRGLSADMIDLKNLELRSWSRLASRLLTPGIAQALLAWLLSSRYDAVYVDRETTGFIFGALNHLRRGRPRLVVIAHLLTSPRKRMLARLCRASRMVDSLIVHSAAQARVARTDLGFRDDQVALLPYQTDDRFWSPQSVPAKRQICSVGLEYRDYDTLIKAVEGLDVEVVIAAASRWSKHRVTIEDIPAHVRVGHYDYQGLRRLYAESLFVVVPLRDIDNQAGITTILEAMAMGKAIIVSRTRGQADVIRDRRSRTRIGPRRATQPDWVRELGADSAVASAQTGIYVPPEDAGELRKAIQFLLDSPDITSAMGASARRVVEETMSIDLFTRRVLSLMCGEGGRHAVAAGDRH